MKEKIQKYEAELTIINDYIINAILVLLTIIAVAAW